MRRRRRRMRSWLRHEQQSTRKALATALQHSYDRVHAECGAPRSQSTATRTRGGRGSHEQEYMAKFRKTPPLQPELFQFFEEEPGGSQPPCLGEPREHRSGFCGTPWSRWPTSVLSCRLSMLLCRRRRTSCWRSSGTWTLCCPSRLSTCPRSHKTEFNSVWWTVICVSRRWRNS